MGVSRGLQQHVTKLHIFITAFVAVKVISVVYLVIYWHKLQSTGTISQGITIGENIIYIMFVPSQQCALHSYIALTVFLCSLFFCGRAARCACSSACCF